MADEKNFLGDMAGNIGEDLKEKFADNLNPEKVFSEGNLKKRRNAFWTCLIAGLLIMVLAFGAAVYINAINVDTFRDQLLEKVDYTALGTDVDSIKSFARETIFYLTGSQDTWNPQIVIGGYPASSFIPQAFRDHMATVKGWFGSATAVLLAGLGIAALLLGRAMIGTKGSKKNSFSLGGYYLGAGIVLALIAGIGLWGYLGFDSLWALVHETLIPDGIFNAAEPVMQLFPVEVFEAYLRPIAITFGVLAAIALVLPLILFPLSKLLTSLFGKKASQAGSSASRSGSATRKRTTASRSSSTRKSSSASKAKKTSHTSTSSGR